MKRSMAIELVGVILAAAALGAWVAAFSPGSFLAGWLAAGALLALVLGGLLAAWRWAGGGRGLAWLVALAFLVRLGLGTALTVLLPTAGYPEPEQQAGYFFYDAWRRDSDAWRLAASGQPLGAAFGNEIATDQYGGLLAVSALVYRTLTPDAHRPLLVVVLAAGAAALGIPFFHKAARRRWGGQAAGLGSAILAFYPESIFLGAAQMREPFLIGLSAVAFWAVADWEESRTKRWPLLALLLSLGGIALISSRAALPIAGILAVWGWAEHVARLDNPRLRRAGWLVLLAGGLLTVVLGWLWVRGVMDWDVLQAVKASGSIQKRLAELGEGLLVPFIAVYGLVRPILPAVVTDPDTVPLWRAAWLVRAAGWYALLPLLVYGLLRAVVGVVRPVGRERGEDRPENGRLARWVMLGFAVTVWAWMLISSVRAGGDQTDNPRYRTILLVWMALMAGWGWVQSREARDPWLGRALAVEAICLAVVTQWYAARYLHWGPALPFWTMIGLAVGLSALAVGISVRGEKLSAVSRQQKKEPRMNADKRG